MVAPSCRSPTTLANIAPAHTMAPMDVSRTDWPSWITAIATAVALLVAGAAVGLQGLDAVERRRQRRLQARFLAIAIQIELHALRARLAQLKSSLVSYLAAPPPGPWAPYFAISAPVEIPGVLTSDVDRLAILGEPAAPSIIRLSAALNVYNEHVQRELGSAFTEPAADSKDHVRRLAGYAEDIDGLLVQVLDQLAPLAAAK